MRLLALAALLVAANVWASERPHFVLIVADDMGWKDVGYNGSEIRTPSIDALAEGGVTLTEFYVHATCSPTRAALMTGQSPMRHGIYHAIGKSTEGSLPLSLKLLPEYLSDAGYESLMVGKWHLGHATSAMLPMARGFEEVYGHYTGGVGYWDHVHGGGLDWHHNGKSLRVEGYATHLQADAAVRMIRERDRQRPLFLYSAFSAPHLPNEAPEESIAAYAGIEDNRRRVHAAMVDELDRAIGRIITTLKEEQMLENTLIWFFSDNGGLNPGAASDGMRSLVSNLVSVFGRPLPTGFLEFLRHNTEDGGSDNGPYRRGKGTVYQDGILVPSFLHWPGTLDPAVVSGRVTVQDVLPTIAELVGINLPSDQALDGKARWGTITGNGSDSAADFVALSMDSRAVLRGPWKLVVSGEEIELYNLAEDPYEQIDRAVEQPELAEQLHSAIDQIPQVESINQPMFRVMMDMDAFGGEEDRLPWADVVRDVATDVVNTADDQRPQFSAGEKSEYLCLRRLADVPNLASASSIVRMVRMTPWADRDSRISHAPGRPVFERNRQLSQGTSPLHRRPSPVGSNRRMLLTPHVVGHSVNAAWAAPAFKLVWIGRNTEATCLRSFHLV